MFATDVIETVVEEFGPDGVLVKRTTTRTPRNSDWYSPYYFGMGGIVNNKDKTYILG